MKRWCALLFCLGLSCQPKAAPKPDDFVDMLGQHVAIKTPVTRVVTAGAIPALNAILTVLGKQSTIQNGMPKQLHAARWAMLRKVSPGLTERPVVSSMGPEWTPDYEALSRLSFDVVVLDSPSNATSMRQRGIPAVTVRWAGADSVKDVMLSLGKLTGASDRARSYVEYYDSLLQRVAARLKPEQPHPSVLYVRLDNFTLPIVTNARDIVQRAGGRYAVDPATVSDHGTFSHEQLMAWDPEVLFVWSPGELERLKSDTRYAELRAVKDHQIYALPMGTHLWLHYSPEVPLGVLWVAHVLHPEAFPEAELEQELTAFYTKFYSYGLSPEEVAGILAGHP